MAKALNRNHYETNQPLISGMFGRDGLLVVRELPDRQRVTDWTSPDGEKKTPCVPGWWIVKHTPSLV